MENLSKELKKYEWFQEEMDKMDLIVLDGMPFEYVNLLHIIISQAKLAIEQLEYEYEWGEKAAYKVIQYLTVQKKRAELLIELSYNREEKDDE